MKKSGNRILKEHGMYYLMPGLIGIGIFYVIPFIRSIGYTFTEGVGQPRFVGLKNFKDLLQNPVFLQAVKNTFIFIAAAVPLVFGISMLLSYSMLGEEHRLVRVALLVPLIVPSSTLLLGIQQLFGDYGMFQMLLAGAGGGQVDFMNDHAFGIVVLIYLLKNVGYMTVILNGAMAGVPREYEEVYRLDSSSGVGFICRIMLPLIMPLVFFVILLSVMNCLKIYREVFALYGDTPPMSVYMLQHFMNNNFFKLNYQRLSAAAFLMVFVLTVFIILFLRMQDKMRVE